MRRFGRRLGGLLRLAFVIWLTTFAAVTAWTYLWPLSPPLPEGDVIVCLSGGGDIPSATPEGMQSRAELCAALHDAGAAPVVLFTGGAIRADLPSSAETMAAATSLPPSVTLLERHAESTLQNALFSIEQIDPTARLIVVTEAYHLPRAWLSFRLMGAQDVTLRASTRVVRSDTGSFWLRNPILRESLAIWFNLGRYMAYRIGGLAGVDPATRSGWLT